MGLSETQVADRRVLNHHTGVTYYRWSQRGLWPRKGGKHDRDQGSRFRCSLPPRDRLAGGDGRKRYRSQRGSLYCRSIVLIRMSEMVKGKLWLISFLILPLFVSCSSSQVLVSSLKSPLYPSHSPAYPTLCHTIAVVQNKHVCRDCVPLFRMR